MFTVPFEREDEPMEEDGEGRIIIVESRGCYFLNRGRGPMLDYHFRLVNLNWDEPTTILLGRVFIINPLGRC